MEHIDWLAIEASAKATEKQLDMPYAWHDNRVYTRREFEELQNEAQKIKMRANIALSENDSNDKRLFFENIDYILAHSDLILSDKQLSTSNPISFRISIRWVGVRSYNLGFVLQNWLNGSWKRKCPDCGESSYLFSFSESKGYVYCPRCKKILKIDIPWEEHKAQVTEIFAMREAQKEKTERERAEAEKAAEKTAKEQKRHEKQNGDGKTEDFREAAKLQSKCEQIPKEELVAQARFEAAQMHGWNIEGWLRKIKENEARLKEYEDIKQGRKLSEVGKLFARMKELAAE